MKRPSLVALAACSTLAVSHALTADDIIPANLVGKTFTFKIAGGSGTAATSGSWTGTFESDPAGGFTIHKISGATVDHSSTYTASPPVSGVTSVTIADIFPNSGQTALSLQVLLGTGIYSLTAANPGPPATFGTQSGTFTLGAPPATAPEISVQQVKGSDLIDGTSKISFGTVKLKKSVAKTFTILNTGSANLTGLAISKSGKHAAQFTVGALSKTTVAPGASATFKVTFKPTTKGTRTASIKIASNDANENPFDIGLTGLAVKP